MKLWLSKNSAVPIREQLTTQIILGVTSGDLKPGARLPSTRELARRFRVHANTVSAAYRELTERGWIELRQDSGVYVRALAPETAALDSQIVLDRIIADFLRDAREKGFSLDLIKRRVADWLELQPPDHFLIALVRERVIHEGGVRERFFRAPGRDGCYRFAPHSQLDTSRLRFLLISR